jgi:pimeloyl-ACP methyl ester carboxylesterase
METLKIGKFGCIKGNIHPDPALPDLIFIHGAALSKGLWKAQVHGLNNIANTYAIDLPGHGDSEGSGRSAISDYSKDVFTFIDEAGLSKNNVILCGMSMGGAVVQQMLIESPGRFKAAVLMNTGARLKVLPAVFDQVRDDFGTFIRNIPVFSLSPSTDLNRFEQDIFDFANTCTAETALGDFKACDSFDVMEKIPSITCPVLVFSAEHDVSTPPKYALWLKNNLPDARLVHILEAGHFSMLEKAGEMNEVIGAFLSEAL